MSVPSLDMGHARATVTASYMLAIDPHAWHGALAGHIEKLGLYEPTVL